MFAMLLHVSERLSKLASNEISLSCAHYAQTPIAKKKSANREHLRMRCM